MHCEKRRRWVRFGGLLIGLAAIDLGSVKIVSADDPTAAGDRQPRVFLLDAKVLSANKERYKAGDKTLTAAVAQLEKDAAAELKTGPFSVIDKDFTPPSGDKHDYMSQAPYFWPDPDKADGLPYIRHDGERNPEINKYNNHPAMTRMITNVDMFALAYYFTDDEKYAQRAGELLRAWFLTPETGMNPNLNFAQAIPGINNGRGIGIIETSLLPRLVDAIGILQTSKSWTADDQHGMEKWLGEYLAWMQESKNGHEEAAAKNNHGTHYDMQVVALALFLGKRDLAVSILNNVGPKRIATQIRPDGSEPLELARTKAWGYSLMNLNGLMSLARLGENVDVDLWKYETPDGRSIRKTIDFLLPYAAGEKKWDHPQLGGWNGRGMLPALRRAAEEYNDDRYKTVAAKLAADEPANWNVVLRFKPAP